MSGTVPLLPGSIGSAVERSLTSRAERGVRIDAVTRVGGGCISPGARIVTDHGDRYFLKWADPGSAPAGFFAEEARSLRALADTGSVRVPGVLDTADDWLLLEWLEPGRTGIDTWPVLGRGLADLHRTTNETFGWPADNYIGSLPQRNDASADWPAFWIERRIRPQWEMARRSGFFDAGADRAIATMAADADALLGAGGRDGPSLLHGDLWGGNVHIREDGTAALIDPSSYFGHREVDLAMARLFGGFDAGFFAAYDEAWPLEPDFDTRRPIYQLYYVLVHVNLFGSGYVAQARSILHRFD